MKNKIAIQLTLILIAGVVLFFIIRFILRKMQPFNTISRAIIAAARSYIGQSEITGNAGFKSSEFEKRMRQVGWNKGEAWCMYLAELAVKEGTPEIYAKCSTTFSGSTLATANNFITQHPETIVHTPVPGCVVIWRHKGTTNGHAGVCTTVAGGRMHCVEGNTNNNGSREGYTTLEKDSPANGDRGSLELYAMIDLSRLK